MILEFPIRKGELFMSCNQNQRGPACCQRPQMPAPPCMNTNCDCNCRPEPPRPGRPVPPPPGMPGRPVPPPPGMPGRPVPPPQGMPGQPMPPFPGMPGRPMPPQGVSGFPSQGGQGGRFPEYTPPGMGYVPMQQWGQVYSPEQAFRQGTIFPELDYPFMMGRCR